MKRAYGKETWFAAIPAREVGRSLLAQHRYAEAEPFLVDSYPILVEQSGQDAGETRSARRAIIDLYIAWGKPQLARPFVESNLEGARRIADAPGADASAVNLYVYTLLSAPFEDLRDVDTALRYAQRAVELSEGTNPTCLHNLARCYFYMGDLDRALELQRRAASLLPAADPDDRQTIKRRLAEYEAAIAGR